MLCEGASTPVEDELSLIFCYTVNQPVGVVAWLFSLAASPPLCNVDRIIGRRTLIIANSSPASTHCLRNNLVSRQYCFNPFCARSYLLLIMTTARSIIGWLGGEAARPEMPAILAHYADTKNTSNSNSIPDIVFETMAKEIENNTKKREWANRPRTYFILWQIKRIDAMEAFIAQGLNDTSIPYKGRTSLPDALNFHEAKDFLRWQDNVCSDVLHVEHGKHVRLQDGNVLFESNRSQLGVGSQG